MNPDTVLRASYGRYNEQPSAAYEQYNGLQQNLPDTLAQFYSLGFTTPGHEVAPSVSYNSDLSIEHHFKGTDMSFKLTPFLRQTQDQIENFYINYTAGLTSGLNAGYQTSSGFEFQFDKGDFSRNGFCRPALVRVHVRHGQVQHAAERHDGALADQRRHRADTTRTRKRARRAAASTGRGSSGKLSAERRPTG